VNTTCVTPRGAGGSSGSGIVDGRLPPIGARRFARDPHPVGTAALVAVSGFVVLCVLVIGLGLFVTNVVAGGAIERGDVDIARWLAEHRTPTRDDLSLLGSNLAGAVTVPAIVLVVVLTLLIRREGRLAALVAISLALEGATYLVVTTVISRDRPAVTRLERLIASDSFPSGHTAAAVALYGCLAVVVCARTGRPAWRGAAVAAAFAAPLVVGVSRVYRGMHYPTDVISGALIGAACLGIAYLAVRSAIRGAEPLR
jgi:membrane-associated phospholipid phosphatase